MTFEEKEISFSSSFEDKKEISFEISKDEELVRDLLLLEGRGDNPSPR
jgi:hypothetical protein